MTLTSVFKSIIIFPASFLFIFITFMAPVVLAQTTPSGVSNTGTPSGVSNNGTKAGAAPSVELKNVAKVGSIQDLLVAILRIVMILMVPIIVFFIILAGFKYATAGGNASQVEEASRALLYAIIGGVLILGAVAISQIIKNVVLQF